MVAKKSAARADQVRHLGAELRPTKGLKPTFKAPAGAIPPPHAEATSEQGTSGVSSFNSGPQPYRVKA
ncbi:hypothetical protein [Pseudomonas chlororaphis]|uniref:hypothetical protein n=1 Tax=Pseudomonas chlororaphis TaxID=587753 RepID=UPI0018F8B68F|nr:hypothetical protein [Pseudomonas chlororaphis]